MRDIEIITPRLVLRVPRPENAREVNAAVNENWHELQKWMSWSHEGANALEATEHYIGVTVPENLAKGDLPLHGFCRETGKFVIATGIHTEDENRSAGYWAAVPFHGKGYATEACNAVLRYAFDAMGAPEMHICHYEGNGPSERVIRKLGFTENGVRIKGKARCLDDKLIDVHDYVMRDPAVLPPLQVKWRPRCR